MAVDSQARNLKESIVEFKAGDDFPLNLIHVQGENQPTKGPVILVMNRIRRPCSSRFTMATAQRAPFWAKAY